MAIIAKRLRLLAWSFAVAKLSTFFFVVFIKNSFKINISSNNEYMVIFPGKNLPKRRKLGRFGVFGAKN
jgi:hypothetical protein